MAHIAVYVHSGSVSKCCSQARYACATGHVQLARMLTTNMARTICKLMYILGRGTHLSPFCMLA